MKRILIIFGILLGLLSSCKDDDVPQPTILRGSLMEGTFVASKGMFKLNGKEVTSNDVTLEFVSWGGKDSAYYTLTIYGLVPYENRGINTTVLISPKENEIEFEGDDIHGSFRPTLSNDSIKGYQLAADYTLKQNNKPLLDNLFVFNKTKSCHTYANELDGDIEVDGIRYSRQGLLDNLCEQIAKLNAKSDSCMKLSFHNDLTMDITSLNNRAGVTVEDSLMTVKFWDWGSEATLEFTREQAEKFVAKWLNDREPEAWVDYVFARYDSTERYALNVCWSLNEYDDKKIFWYCLAPDFRLRALFVLINGKFKDTLSEEELRKIKAAYTVIRQDGVNERLLPFWHSEFRYISR